MHAVILAGGSGTRLWPLSRLHQPKFLHPLSGSPMSLLQATVERVAPLAGPDQTVVVTGAAHAASVARQLTAVPEENILVEPSARDSCAAVGLAAALIARRSPEAIMGAFAADHLITNPARFVEVVREAVAGAERGLLMTIAIKPTRPETGYGYLACGDEVGPGPVRMVEAFTEKPAYEVAKRYVEDGNHLWNAGMFVWRVDAFLAELARQQPALHEGLCRVAAAWDEPDRDEVLSTTWPTLTKISVDYAVMEGAAAAGRVGTVPGDFGWTDVGDFQTLGDVLPGDSRGNVVVGGSGDKPGVLLRDTDRLVVVPQSGRLVAALGVENLVIVDTPDVVLVCARERSQEVKKLVDELKSRGDEGFC
ncbi:mannose-1-phosphate guanylyltransferase [Asanoa siamensis]|uniref:Mannose-1-phosphate guanyltransferase n=1 Tax=Asanoa siamensis TaxID=926357 RepID=A0ABQ4D4G8_9ACTN|nr:sugar phosphate nucleotidyltransferase [Asanoa siamensis]GIF78400.1 mannose-1-phosphate guanyltransferase [Asanoa siamensis]